jgi:hypothetical protein
VLTAPPTVIRWAENFPAALKGFSVGCSNGNFEMIDALGARITIPNAEITLLIPIGGQTLTYFCNGDQKTLTCPAPATFVSVNREPDATNKVVCFTDQAAQLEVQHKSCNGDYVVASHAQFDASDTDLTLIPRGATASFPTSDMTLAWDCISQKKMEDFVVTVGYKCTLDANGTASNCKPTGSVDEGFLQRLWHFFSPPSLPRITCPLGTNTVTIQRPADPADDSFKVWCDYRPRPTP